MLWGWVVCIAATILVLDIGFRLTRGWRPVILRDFVRMFAVTTLLTPVASGPEAGNYAPAYIVLIFETVLQAEGDPVDALTALTIAWTAGLLLLVGLTVFRLWRGRRRRARAGGEAHSAGAPESP